MKIFFLFFTVISSIFLAVAILIWAMALVASGYYYFGAPLAVIGIPLVLSTMVNILDKYEF